MKATRWYLRNAREYERGALVRLDLSNYWAGEGENRRNADRLMRDARRSMKMAVQAVEDAFDSEPDRMISVSTYPHQTDRDCDLDENNVCLSCHVEHGGACGTCEGRGFHQPGCPEMTDPAEPKVLGGRG